MEIFEEKRVEFRLSNQKKLKAKQEQIEKLQVFLKKLIEKINEEIFCDFFE